MIATWSGIVCSKSLYKHEILFIRIAFLPFRKEGELFMPVYENRRLLSADGDFDCAGIRSVEIKKLIGPAHVIGNLAGLHAVKGIIQFLGNGADLFVGDLVVGALVVEAADGRNDRRGAGGKDLLEGAVLGSSDDVVVSSGAG